MAEVVGEAFLSAFVHVLLDMLASRDVINFFGTNHQIAELLEKLNITLWSAKALLNDAEEKQINDANVKNWVDKLSEVLSEADDVIDKINTEALRCKIEERHESPRNVSKIIMKLNKNPFNSFYREIKASLESILDRLKFLLDQKDFLGFKEGVQSRRVERSPTPLIEYPCDVYGKDEDREAIIEWLLSEVVESEKISVMSIVGMGGIGKTTLARLVYNDGRVKNHFSLKSWITVSDDFYVFRLAKLVLEGLTSKKCDAEEIDQLQVQLEDSLMGEKFLLVLDDVWNEDYEEWDALNSYFRSGASGSKIIVTTRNKDVGSKMGNVPPFYVKEMSDEDSWRLFKKHAFHNIDIALYGELEVVGKEIVKKCKGLPLAAKSLGGLLRSVPNPKEWEMILKSDVWELHKKGSNKILPSLWLSYSYLPSHLKRCFAYCSIFPKGYEYEKGKIVLLWMAEGILEGENKEDLGEEYFEALISRSLLQRSSKDNHGSTALMHDLVHDLAMFVSVQGSCVRLSNDDNLQNLITDKTRHLLFEKPFFYAKKVDGLSIAKRLRTFLGLPFGVFSNAPRLDTVKLYDVLLTMRGCLRVLSLYGSSVREMPDSIGDLKQIRYFDLSGTRIKRLPDPICTLYNLQTLLLIFCTRLSHLPDSMETLINLRHLDISDTYSLKTMPLNICNLKPCRRLENVVDVEHASNAGLKNKHLVVDLSLSWCGETNDSQHERAVLDALQPHSSLKKLRINGYGGTKFSDWIGDKTFSSITEVYLSNCKHCYQLPPLGQLASLKELTVCGFDSIERVDLEFYCSTTLPFKSLESLCFEEMGEWQFWAFNGAFPCLKKLRLVDCPKLNSPLPHCLPSLKSLEILQCQQMEILLPRGQDMNTSFPSLESIDRTSCPKLEFSVWPLPSSLVSLSISNCQEIFANLVQWDLKTLGSLKNLSIKGHSDVVESFPDEGFLPSSLISLCIADVTNLKALSGKGFRNLTALKDLTISYCSELQCLLEDALPASLSSLYVCGCPTLERRFQRDIGED